MRNARVWMRRSSESTDGLDNDADAGVECLGNAAQHAQRVAFVAGRFEAANVLLRSLEHPCQLPLGQSRLLA